MKLNLLTALLSLTALVSTARAQEMTVIDPSRSGIPGEEVRFVRHAPDGDVWVGARWPFWGEGGIGILDRQTDRWTVLSSAAGDLPSQFVNDLEFAADGSAWIATGAGLVHWVDGAATVFDSGNSPMTLDVVNDLSIAPDGDIWFNSSSSSSSGDAVYEFDGVDGWNRYTVPDDIPFAAPWTDLSEVFADSQGRVWVANNTLTGVARFEGGVWTLLGEGVDRFDEMAEDGFGNIWFNTNLVGSGFAYYRFDGQTLKQYGFDSSTTLTTDPEDGAVYVANWHGTVLRSTDGGESFHTFVSGLNIIFSVAPDPQSGEVWIGTIGAVGRFDGGGALLEDFNSYNTGMPWYWVDRFDVDSRGNLWVATDEAGLSRFDGRVWRNWGAHNLGAEPYPFAGNEPMGGAFEDSQGRFWFGGNGIARWDDETGGFDGFWNWQNNPGMGVTQFPFFAEDAQGNVFAATENGTPYRFDDQAQLWVKEPIQPYAVLGLPGMESDSDGDVWIAAWFDLHHWDGTAWTKVALPYADYFFDKGGISSFAIGPDDTFYFGTVDGLVTYDGATFQFYEPSNSPLPAGQVPGIDVRADGLIGLTSRGNGSNEPSTVCLIDGPIADAASWTVYAYGSSPLPHWQTTACAFEPTGDLWVSALSEGVAVVQCGVWEDLGLALEGSGGEPYLRGYGVPTGGAAIGLEVEHLPGASIGVHVVGGFAVGIPLFGGTLVPDPALQIPYLSDAGGQAGLAITWPAAIPSGTSMYVQSWTLDGGAAQQVSASNAVVLSVP
ncbi:ligand-binding sensor domain-containing protein [Engelhardtia mirabilis]|uniref:Two component regulator propeller n=1 Tax=Engelhardtia mirabilis TaxID=2528011 RepID=A0A518BFT7_9BACT|nr:Two component regulator propeller [Planctomycetes bacterium Pla133]QDV00176.1 Two component regulator propeller [Planctomycetes bacterium Pla86]